MDEDLKELFKNLGKAIVIIIVFIFIVYLALKNKFNSDESKPLKLIRSKTDAVLLLSKTKCDNCKEIKQKLKDLNVEYSEIKTDTEKYYDTILKELEISINDISEPTIITIKNGSVISIYVDVSDMNELENYLDSYELIN